MDRRGDPFERPLGLGDALELYPSNGSSFRPSVRSACCCFAQRAREGNLWVHGTRGPAQGNHYRH